MGYDPVGHGGDVQCPRVLHAGDPYLLDDNAQFLKGLNCQPYGFFHFAVEFLEIVVGWDADLQSGEVLSQRRRIVRHGYGYSAGVKGVVTGDGLQHQRAVADRPGHRPDVVSVEARYQQAALTDPSEGLLEPHHAAEGAGQPDGAAKVGAKRGKGHAAGHVGRAAPAGAAGDVVQVPRVMHGAVKGIVGCCAGGELLQVLLAQDYRAGLLASPDHLGVLVRHIIGQDTSAQSGQNPCGGEIVLDPDGDALQRAQVFAPCYGRLLFPRLAARLVVQDGDEGVQLWLQAFRTV